jgi:hypothetical protein
MTKLLLFHLAFLAAVLLTSATAPADAPPTAPGKWLNFTDTFNKATGNTPKKNNFRLALAVDPASGNLFVSRWFTGVWMSGDRAATFARVDGDKINGGGPFTCYAMVASPEGGKLAVFNMNNNPGPSGYSLDGGKTWESFESVGRNWDYAAVDWESKAILALRHEDNGVHLSADMGKTWTQLELKRGELSGAGLFNANELVIARWNGIQRSEDAGKTWAGVSPLPCTGTLQVHKGEGYWLCNRRTKEKKSSAVVVATKDNGKTWQELGQALDDTMFCSGPFFGKDAGHLVVATLKEIVESRDGGATWKKVSDYPADIPPFGDHKNGCGFPSLGYDAAGDVFYVFFPNMKNWPEGQLWKYAR